MRLGDRPDERALDREHAVRDAPGDDCIDDVGERRQRDEARGREEPVAGGRGVGAFAAGIGDGEFDGSHGAGAPFDGGRFAGTQLDGARQGRRRRLARKGEAERRAGESGWRARDASSSQGTGSVEGAQHRVADVASSCWSRRGRVSAPRRVRRRRRARGRRPRRRGRARGRAAARPSGAWPPGSRSRGRRSAAPSRARARRCPARRLPSDADAASPRPPVTAAATSERMSPKVFSVTTVSIVSGACTIFIANESTSAWSSSISG